MLTSHGFNVLIRNSQGIKLQKFGKLQSFAIFYFWIFDCGSGSMRDLIFIWFEVAKQLREYKNMEVSFATIYFFERGIILKNVTTSDGNHNIPLTEHKVLKRNSLKSFTP